MRLSRLFGQMQKEAPRFAPDDGRHWLERGAFIFHHDDGSHAWLPLGERLLAKLRVHLGSALAEVNPQSAHLPWLDSPADALAKLPRGLEAMLSAHVSSYRHLPAALLHRSAETMTMLALTPSPESAVMQSAAAHDLWQQTLNHLGLLLLPGEGAPLHPGRVRIGFAPSPVGEETLTCSMCGYRAQKPWARRQKPRPQPEEPKPLTAVPTPEANTIRALADFLGVPESKTAKAVFFSTVEPKPRVVFAVVRGDMQVSEAKIARLLGVEALQPAAEEQIRAIGAVPGYASPIGVRDCIVVVDDLIPNSPNLVAGANKSGYHYINVNYGRDFQADFVADIVKAEAGDPCPRCGAPLSAEFALPVVESWPLRAEATYLSREGKEQVLGVALARVDLYAALVALAAKSREGTGLAWPRRLAPYDVHLIALRGGEDAAEELYRTLPQAGFDVLYDDRQASAGVKFAAADLVGLPWRVTVGKRSLANGGAEVKPRRGSPSIIPLGAVADFIANSG